MSRPYTGAKDGIAKRKRPGTEHFAALVQYLTGGKLWNNGTLEESRRSQSTQPAAPSISHSVRRPGSQARAGPTSRPGSTSS